MNTENGSGASAAAGAGISALPLGYSGLEPLVAERHKDLGFRRRRDFRFAEKLHAAPLAVEEFSRAHFDYPVVFTRTDPVLPVALLGMTADKNDFVGDDGQWTSGTYVPSYLRRYPFALARENDNSQRMLLCADLNAPNFDENAGPAEEKLFENGDASEYGKAILDFCQKYEEAMARTRRTCEHLASLELFESAVVTLQRPDGKPVRIDGFRIVSEEKVRKLEDAQLADLARRGVMGLIAAHHFSISRFSGLLQDSVAG